MDDISSFTNKYFFLSNFYWATVQYEDKEYRSPEHAFQAAKTDNKVHRDLIRNAQTPSIAKSLGRRAPRRNDWDDVRVGIMKQILQSKFENPHRATLLLETGDAQLIEGNAWGDRFWGVSDGEGENWLGKILMEIREELRVNDK